MLKREYLKSDIPTPFKNEKELYKFLLLDIFWNEYTFDVDECKNIFDVMGRKNMYDDLLWKTLSVLETTIEKDKLESTKSILKQLFRATYNDYEYYAVERANLYYNEKEWNIKK